MEKSKKRDSKIDRLASTITNRFKFFSKGIGDKIFLDQMESTIEEIKHTHPIQIDWTSEKKTDSRLIQKGNFLSPFSWFLPTEAKMAHVELIRPLDFQSIHSIAIHFAMTGDQGFYKRRYAMAYPLLKKGIASLLLEIPFYGMRKPKDQFSIFLSTLSDFFKMSFGTVVEGLSLVDWCKRNEYKNVIVTGISMGGNIASFVGSLSQHELGIVPCISPHSPLPVFLEGMLSNSIHWKALTKEFGDLEIAKSEVAKYMSKCELTMLLPPKNSSKVIIVAGKKDGYVFPDSVNQLHEHWKGSEIRWINTGHIGAIFAGTPAFRKAIEDVDKKF